MAIPFTFEIKKVAKSAMRKTAKKKCFLTIVYTKKNKAINYYYFLYNNKIKIYI